MDDENLRSHTVKVLKQSLSLTVSFLKPNYISRISKYYNLTRTLSRFIKRHKSQCGIFANLSLKNIYHIAISANPLFSFSMELCLHKNKEQIVPRRIIFILF